MARIAPQTAPLPVGGPDTLLTTAPPGALFLGTTDALQLTLAVTVGEAIVTPYFWNNTSWCPLGDVTSGLANVKANVASIPVANLVISRAAEPRFWAVVKTGAGTVDYCDISEAVINA